MDKLPLEQKDRSVKRQKILTISKWLWMMIVLLGAGYYFYRHWDQVQRLLNEVSVLRLLGSLSFLILGKFGLVLLMKFSVEAEGWKPTFWETLGIYGFTSLGKYIPGGVWHFIGRIGIYKAKKLDAKQIFRTMILENYWLLSSALALGLLSLAFFRFEMVQDLLKTESPSILGFIVGLVVVVFWFLTTVLIHRYFEKHTLNKIVGAALAMFTGVVAWVLIGLSFFVMFPDRVIGNAPIYIGGYAISWAVGYIAIFAPGGLGIREAALAFVFSNIASVELIAVYAAMNRIIWVIAEVLFGLVGMFQKKIMSASTKLTIDETEQLLEEPITEPNAEE